MIKPVITNINHIFPVSMFLGNVLNWESTVSRYILPVFGHWKVDLIIFTFSYYSALLISRIRQDF